MAQSWVKVVRDDGGGLGDAIFIDENYGDAGGFVGTAFETDTGKHTFETLDAGGLPAWSADQVIGRPAGNSEQHPVVVTLTRV
jgi:hypothetical protein